MLRALAASAAAPLVVPVLQACGSNAPRSRAPARLETLSAEPIRATLREVVASLSVHFAQATGHVTLRQIGRAMVDADERGVHRETTTVAILGVEHQGRRFEQATTELSPDGIAAAAELLRTRMAAGYQAPQPAMSMATPRDFRSPVTIDPRTVPMRAWIPRLEQLYRDSLAVGGSRIVYRSAYLTVEDRTDIFIGSGRDLSQQLVRTRSGVVLIARRNVGHTPVPVVEVAEQSGLMGLEATSLPRPALEAAADRVLAMVSPTAYPTGVGTLILAPTVAGLFCRECIGPALDGRRWVVGESRAATLHKQQIASERVTLIDDPSAPGAYGSYFFDDEGLLAQPARLIENGTLIRPVTDRACAAMLGLQRTANGRRPSPLAPVRAHVSNLSLAPGQSSREQLIAKVDRGLLLDGGLYAQVDPVSWRFSLRVARAYEIRGGKATGVLYSDLDVRGQVPDVLRAVADISATSVRIPSLPLPASTSSPYLLTRAEVV